MAIESPEVTKVKQWLKSPVTKEITGTLEINGILRRNWWYSETIYVSPTGGGDGSSPSNPTTLDDALTRIRSNVVTIYLLDGTYYVDKNYSIVGDLVTLASYSGDPSLCKIVFNSYADTSYNYVYRFAVGDNCRLAFTKITLETAGKADTTLPWQGEGACPIRLDRRGNSAVYFTSCIINQVTPYFVDTKHSSGDIILVSTTINMSGDAISFNLTDYGTVRIGWWNSSITSGYKLTNGFQGRDVLFSGNINAISASQTWFSQVPESVLPNADNTHNLGSSTLRWANVYAYKVFAYGDNAQIVVYSDSLGGCAGSMEYDPTTGSILFRSPFSKPFRFAQTIIPSSDNSFNLGSSTLRWANVYAVKVKAYTDCVIPTAAPTAPESGSMYFDTTTNTLYIYNGTAWVGVTLA